MILTLTANPAIDRTLPLTGRLTPGGVHRLGPATDQAAGKGVNVARVVALAGGEGLAVLPAHDADPFVQLLTRDALPVLLLAPPGPVRTNLSLTEPDGTTTKLNEPGTPWGPDVAQAVRTAVLEVATGAQWVVLAGSLPPGAPEDFYAQLIEDLAGSGVSVALDASGPPLSAAVTAQPTAPQLIKPNVEELAELTGREAGLLEAQLQGGSDHEVLAAAREVVRLGIGAVLVTLGSHGARLVTADGAWGASTPPITPRSTVGAGDASLAGYLLADLAGEPPIERLRRAVAYGSAATARPGTSMPRPRDLDLSATPAWGIEPTDPKLSGGAAHASRPPRSSDLFEETT